MYERFLSAARRGLLTAAAGAAMLASLAGCGGEGAGAGGVGAGGGGSAATVSDIHLFSDKPTLSTSGGTATITAQVKNANNNVIPNRAIQFTTADDGVALTPSGPVTDAAGKATATLDFRGSPNAQANRTITVQVTAGDVTRTIQLAVDDTSLGVSDINLLLDKPTLPTSGGTATIIAQVKNANNNVMPNQAIRFTTADDGVALTPSGPVTDAAGKATAKLDLGGSSNTKANRTITVQVTAGRVVRTVQLAVEGTTLAIAGPASLPVGTVGKYTVSLLDSAGNGVPGVTVTGHPGAGNMLAPAMAVTGPYGQVTMELRGTVAGNGALSVSALGMNMSRPVTFTSGGMSLSLVAPTPGVELDVNFDAQVQAHFADGGVPRVGATVDFATTRGVFTGVGGNQPVVSVLTDNNGNATVSLRSASAGLATVTATVRNTTVSTSGQIEFASRTPAKITLSPSPTSIAVNAPGSSSSTSQLIAVVRDATDNPVKGVTVAFSASSDPSSGRIEPGTAVTNSAGVATATFIAGPNSTGPQAVQLQATVVGAPTISAPGTMTVSSSALFVELGTGKEIESISSTSYRMPWTAIVTDANRNPVAGAKVSVSLAAVSYYKGVWTYNGQAWVPTAARQGGGLPLECGSEDANENNLLDAGEDFNGNAKLDPGSPAAVAVASPNGQTNGDGLADIAIIYPKSFGNWVKVRMRVTIATTGTESSIFRTFVLPPLGADVAPGDSAPPNTGGVTPSNAEPPGALVGPYGYTQSCSDPN